jgi:multiple sugar transport system ATP-binding protein
MSKIELRDIRKSFGGFEVIKGIDLDIPKGEFMVFVGPSGCGKSTLLRLVAGLEDITSGNLQFDGVTVNNLLPAKRRIAMVFQSYALYPHMTVYNNMAFGLKLANTDTQAIREKVLRAAAMLQIEPLLERLPRQLSGGQRQRVAIGRAITRDPAVFLFDEPLSNLDAALRVQTRLEIARLHKAMHDVTMIYVTHDQVEAMTMADRICVLRDGLVEQVGTPMDLYEKPANLFVATFIGSPKMNLIARRTDDDDTVVTIGVRPEHLVLSDDGSRWRGAVVHSEDLGADHMIYVDVGAMEPLSIRQSGKATVPLGQMVGIAVHDDNIYRFDRSGCCLDRRS